MARKLLLVDANSLIHRAFHALPRLTSTDGQPTGAAFGLTQMLLVLLQDQEPDEVAMVFDAPGGTFRHQLYGEYKANRPEMDEELSAQYPIIHQIMDLLGLRMLEKPGYEADDIIGTLADRGVREGYEVTIVTGDGDLLQLVRDGVRVLVTTRGITQTTEYDRERFGERYGLAPEQLVDLKALMGDSSDNIPGIPGIGQKTAQALLAEHASVEAILEHLEQLPPRVRDRLLGREEDALLYKQLAQIDRHVPLDADSDDLSWSGPDVSALRQLLARLEFTSLLDRLPQSSEIDMGSERGRIADADEQAILHICEQARRQGKLYAVLTVQGQNVAVALAAGTDHAVSVLLPEMKGAAGKQQDLFATDESIAALPAPLIEVLGDERVAIAGCRLKQLDHMLSCQGIVVQHLSFDAEVASYLLSPLRSDHGIAVWAAQYLGWQLPQAGAEPVEGLDSWRARGCLEALAVAQLQPRLERELEQQDQMALFRDIEMPLVSLLARMERAGIGLDLQRLEQMGDELSAMMDRLAAEIHDLAGEQFNIDSPKQVGQILFDRLQLPHGRKTKTGWSTAAGILDELAAEHRIVALILEYREYAKLRGTYVDGLAREADHVTGLVHTSFEQTATATGRLASRAPNLQNIPIRTEWGRQIRSCFNSGLVGYQLICADYSQIELRILAHLSEEPVLLQAFTDREDIHVHTATLIFDCTPEQVDYQKRSAAKMVNYALLYGMGPRALADSLGIDVEQAGQFIDNYHRRLPKVSEFLEGIVTEARKTGYVDTLMGRRRPTPELNSGNGRDRAYAERAAVNAPMQGGAADIVKLAMLRVDEALRNQYPQVEMLLQVHDEIVLRAPEDSLEPAAQLVREVMENAYTLRVPLIVDVMVGQNWRDLQPLATCPKR